MKTQTQTPNTTHQASSILEAAQSYASVFTSAFSLQPSALPAVIPCRCGAGCEYAYLAVKVGSYDDSCSGQVKVEAIKDDLLRTKDEPPHILVHACRAHAHLVKKG